MDASSNAHLARLEKTLQRAFEDRRPSTNRFDALEAEEHHRVALQRRQQTLERSGVIRHLTDADTRLLVQCEAKDTPCLTFVRRWYQQREKPVALLLGTIGRGKTVAAGWAVAEHGSGRYVTAHRVLRIFGGRYGDALALQDELLLAHLLVIDDVGREPTGDRDLLGSALVEILDERRGGGVRTILASNLSTQGFRTQYPDERLASRLHQSAMVLEDTGPDLRRDPR